MWLSTIAMDHDHFVRAGSRWHDGDWAHKRVMALFSPDLPGESVRQRHGVLFRTEPELRRVLVQALVQPLPRPGLRSVDLSVVVQALTNGQTVQFTWKANAVKTVNRTGPDGRVACHRQPITEAERELWVRRCLDWLDMGADSFRLVHTVERVKKAPLDVVTVVGTGTLIDADRARAAVLGGLGRAKAYGCGMLSVVPSRTAQAG